MNGVDDDFGGVRYRSLQIGEVVDRDDPEGLGRVKVHIPGLCEPSTGWAFPLGTVGGGKKARGFKYVPQVGAEVGVLFKGGDPDAPYYIAGHWGKPDGVEDGTEIPGAPDGTDPDVHVLEFKKYKITFDEREGKESMRIEDKDSGGDSIEFDGTSATGPGITIKASAGLVIEVDGMFSVDASTIVLNGRKLSDGPQDV